MNQREIDEAMQWIKALPEITLEPWQEQAMRAILGAERVVQKQPVTQCKAESMMFGTRCLLAEGHAAEHRNSSEGIHWSTPSDEHEVPLAHGGKVEAPVHFAPYWHSERTICGMYLGHGVKATYNGSALSAVTCKHCRKELGLEHE